MPNVDEVCLTQDPQRLCICRTSTKSASHKTRKGSALSRTMSKSASHKTRKGSPLSRTSTKSASHETRKGSPLCRIRRNLLHTRKVTQKLSNMPEYENQQSVSDMWNIRSPMPCLSSNGVYFTHNTQRLSTMPDRKAHSVSGYGNIRSPMPCLSSNKAESRTRDSAYSRPCETRRTQFLVAEFRPLSNCSDAGLTQRDASVQVIEETHEHAATPPHQRDSCGHPQYSQTHMAIPRSLVTPGDARDKHPAIPKTFDARGRPWLWPTPNR